MQLKVFFFSGGIIKRFSFEISYSVDPRRIMLLQGRLLPVDCDPSLWKCTVLDQVHFDCIHHKVTCIFVDGEAQVLAMSSSCATRLLASVSKLTEVGLEPTNVNGSSRPLSAAGGIRPGAKRSPLSKSVEMAPRQSGEKPSELEQQQLVSTESITFLPPIMYY